MNLRRIASADFWKVWGPLAVLVAAGFALAASTIDPPPPRQFAIATGSADGAYYAFAQRYREIFARQGYELDVVETAGSIENQDLLRRGEVQLALLQGGVVDRASLSDVEAIASIFLEPIWLFHRGDLVVDDIGDLAGLRLAVGGERSGTRALVLRLLGELGLDEGNVTLLADSGTDAAEALLAGRLDAAFFVASADASYVRRLLAEDGVRLFSVRRSRAYQRLFPFLSAVVLGEGMIDLAVNVPGQDVHLLAAACSLAVSTELDDQLVPLLLDVMREVHGGGGLFEDPGQFPASRFLDLPQNVAAHQFLEYGPSFLQRILPFHVALTISRLKILLLPLLTLLIPVLKAAPPLYRWRIRSKIYRWYGALRELEEKDLTKEAGDDPERQAEVLEEQLAALDALEEEARRQVSVPPAYMDELYHLQMHVEMARFKLRRRRRELRRKAAGERAATA